jgi:LTXXQ motif family protein
MPKVSTRLAAATLIIAVTLLFVPQAAVAFGLRLGPFHLYLPGPHYHRHYHGRIARAEPGEVVAPVAPEQTASGSPSLLYPVLAWPALDDEIFWPRGSVVWAFSYEDIFSQAFAKYSPQRVAAFCPTRMSVDELVMRIARETTPTAAQKPLLQNLATALGQANGYLIKSCPSEIPPQPAARMQLMENQIDAMIMALDIVRPQLQAFEQSLDDKQRARLNAAVPLAANAALPACKLNADAASGPLSQLEQAVEPTDAQRPALAAVADAFKRAAEALDASCATVVPPTALGRLEAAETRLDATWRAVQTIQVALANLQSQLSTEQNSRLNAMEIVATH